MLTLYILTTIISTECQMAAMGRVITGKDYQARKLSHSFKPVINVSELDKAKESNAFICRNLPMFVVLVIDTKLLCKIKGNMNQELV